MRCCSPPRPAWVPTCSSSTRSRRSTGPARAAGTGAWDWPPWRSRSRSRQRGSTIPAMLLPDAVCPHSTASPRLGPRAAGDEVHRRCCRGQPRELLPASCPGMAVPLGEPERGRAGRAGQGRTERGSAGQDGMVQGGAGPWDHRIIKVGKDPQGHRVQPAPTTTITPNPEQGAWLNNKGAWLSGNGRGLTEGGWLIGGGPTPRPRRVPLTSRAGNGGSGPRPLHGADRCGAQRGGACSALLCPRGWGGGGLATAPRGSPSPPPPARRGVPPPGPRVPRCPLHAPCPPVSPTSPVSPYPPYPRPPCPPISPHIPPPPQTPCPRGAAPPHLTPPPPPGVLPLSQAWGRAPRLPPSPLPAQRRAFSNNKILVELDESAGVATMKFKSPPVNSLSLDFLTEFCISLEKLENDRACRGVILTSAVPKIFSSGLDITEMCGKSTEHYAEFWRAVQEMWLRLYSSNMVTVAAVNGSSPAGGCLIALTCDYRIMAENPKFSIGLNEAQLGIVAPFWFKDTFVNVVGHRVAESSLQLGSLHPAPEAHRIGLVDELVPEEKLKDRATAVMQQWLALPDHARQLTKTMMRKAVLDRLVAHREEDVQNFISFISKESIQKSLRMYMEMLKKKKG
uniref:Enoyl-CoA delta isomerase 1, mitochondrial n=1 Tax=Anas platyrhynchos platyrhynchos TaxID=8840 RepID=U3ILK4_ANAPP